MNGKLKKGMNILGEQIPKVSKHLGTFDKAGMIKIGIDD